MKLLLDLYTLSLQPAITLGWPITYIELVILVFNVLCVYLVGKNKVINYPIGIVAIVLYMFFCYTLHFYSEYFLQIFFFVFSFVGWYMWGKKKDDGTPELKVRYLKNTTSLIILVFWLLCTYALGSNINAIFNGYVTHVLFPIMDVLDVNHEQYVFQDASFPYMDAFTVVGQVLATFLMIRRYVESWIIWITIDVLSTYMFYIKAGYGVSLMFAIFTVLAVIGLYRWIAIVKKESVQ